MDGSKAKVPVNYSSYNHGVSDVKAYYKHRELSEAQIAMVRAGKASGIPANRIKGQLKAAYPSLEIQSRDIYNWTARIARDVREGLPLNEALIQKLIKLKEEGKVFFEYTLIEEERIQKMFIADMQ